MPLGTRVWREGIVTGLLGAAGVALWFFVVDVVSGTPLATPEMLGRVMFGVLGIGIPVEAWANIVGYTAAHLVAFLLVGTILSVVVDISHRIPVVLAGLLLLFVMMEVGFFGLTLLFSQSAEWTGLAWYHVSAANLVAAGLMGAYLWREHPGLASRFAKVLDGRI